MFMWKYTVHGYGGIDVGDYIETGISFGGNLKEVVGHLEGWYGDEIVKLEIEVAGDDGEPYVLERTVQN